MDEFFNSLLQDYPPVRWGGTPLTKTLFKLTVHCVVYRKLQALAPFLAFNKISFESFNKATDNFGVDKTVDEWINTMLRSRIVNAQQDNS